MDLLICYTPLHVVIAEALIKRGDIKDYALVYICFGRNEKHDYYYGRISQGAVRSCFVEMKHAAVHDAVAVLKLRLGGLAGLKFDRLFTGNVKHIYSRLLAYLCGDPDIYTFDDGSGNISGSGYFYEMTESRLSQWVFSVLAPRYLYKNVVSRIATHYSVYDFKNVYSDFASKISKVSLFSPSVAAQAQDTKGMVVYLGNAFSKDGLCSKDYEDALDDYVIKKYGVKYIIPHPRNVKQDLYEKLDIQVLGGAMIAEDIILEQLVKGVRMRVVGVYSSVLFNIAGLDGVHGVNVRAEIAKPVDHLGGLLGLLGVVIDDGFVSRP